MSFTLAFAAAAHAQDRTEQLLQRLADAPGPPGAEEPVRVIMVPEMKQFSSAPIRFDGIGSVITEQGAPNNAKVPRIMIDAHMDELGGMVRRVTPNGFLTMQMLVASNDREVVEERSGCNQHVAVCALDRHMESGTLFSRAKGDGQDATEET